MIVDAHCHYKLYDNNLNKIDALFDFIENNNLLLAFNSITKDDWGVFESFINQSNSIVCFFGIHPFTILDNSLDVEKSLILLSEKLVEHKNIGVGEIGLDKRVIINTKEQEILFYEQIKLAIKYKRSAVIHCVRSFDIIFRLLNTLKNIDIPLLFHSFYSSVEVLENIMKKYNAYISFSPKSLLKSNKSKIENIISKTPINRILLESDISFTNNFREEEYIKYLENLNNFYHKISLIKGINIEDLKSNITNNFIEFTKFSN